MRTSKTVTTKTYAIAKHTVTFVADGVTVKTMTVDDGYVLKASDYPAVPAKAGYIGSWNKYNGSITSDRTIQASYRLPNRCVVTFKVENTVLKTMTVDEGYVLTAFDYPAIPPKPNCHTIWSYHTKPITADTTVTGAYIPNEGPDITIPPTPTTPPDIEFASVGDEEDVEESQADNASAEDAVSATAANSPVMELISTVTERHDYIYAGGKLLRETITTTAANGTVSTQILDFTYDATGSPYSLTYTSGTSTTVFYYITNLQGDVVSLLNASGDEVAAYTYDPYGRPVTIKGRVGTTLQTITDPTHIANRNPLRYRGYYYDNETGFYYLQSRYYDPAICRFINADEYASTGQGFTGYNMFAYCLNNPIGLKDSGGSRAVESNTVVVFDGSYLEGYMSAEQAAMVFGQKYSYHTVISGKEIAANIFVRDVGGQQRYFIGDIYFGGPSSVTIISYINNPEWAAYVHTHPMGSCEFSKKDLERIRDGLTGRADFRGFILTGDETLWMYDMEQKQSVPVGHYNMVPYKIRGGSDAARISKVNMLY